MGFFDVSIPDSNTGFGIFSRGHLIWIAAGICICVIAAAAFRNRKDSKKARMAFASAILFLELFRAVLLIRAGEYDMYTLPLHLCGIAVYIIFLHAISGNELTGQFLYAFCMPGAAFAVVFPDWYYYPMGNVLTVIGFVIHILITAYPLAFVRRDCRYLPRCLLLMLLMAVPVYIVDRIYNLNYMFLNWPVPPLTLFEKLGRPGYVAGYIPIIAITWMLIYLVPDAAEKNKKRRSE